MERHDPKECIVQNSFGSYHIYPCSVDVAKQLLIEKLQENNNLGYSEEQQLFDNPLNLTLSEEHVKRALKQVFAATDSMEPVATHNLRYLMHGPSLNKQADTRPEIDKEECKKLQKEILQWAIDHGVSLSQFPSPLYEVLFGSKKKHDPLTLPFMQGIKAYADLKQKNIVFVSEDALTFLDEKRVLLNDRWKEHAKPASVVARYLSFMNQYLCHRDDRFELGHIELEYASLIQTTPTTNSEPTDTSPTM